MNYAPNFEVYLEKQFIPAQKWALSKEGKKWIENCIPTLAVLIENRYDDCIFGVYIIRLNGRPLYIGESIRTVRRLCVHAYNLNQNPELFGLDNVDNKSVNISMEFLKERLYDENLRKAEEKYYIDKMNPLLQTTKNSDVCLPRCNRKKAIQSALHIA